MTFTPGDKIRILSAGGSERDAVVQRVGRKFVHVWLHYAICNVRRAKVAYPQILGEGWKE